MTANTCPLCKKEGSLVPKITVDNMLLEHFKKRIKSQEYYICNTPECDMVYFSRDTDEMYFQRDLKLPVWFKNQDNPIICYCSGITLQDIINEIVIKKTSQNINDIMENTSAGRVGRCKSTNPSGKCCMPVLEDAVAYAIRLRDEKSNT